MINSFDNNISLLNIFFFADIGHVNLKCKSFQLLAKICIFLRLSYYKPVKLPES